MELRLKRMYFKETYTIGQLFLDGSATKFCDTLEDKVRADGVKVYGETAIADGRYKISITYSPKFKRRLPELLNVPMFTNIRIHAGNTPDDTLGCILVGENKEVGKLVNSRATENRLMQELNGLADDEELYITIEN